MCFAFIARTSVLPVPGGDSIKKQHDGCPITISASGVGGKERYSGILLMTYDSGTGSGKESRSEYSVFSGCERDVQLSGKFPVKVLLYGRDQIVPES